MRGPLVTALSPSDAQSSINVSNISICHIASTILECGIRASSKPRTQLSEMSWKLHCHVSVDYIVKREMVFDFSRDTVDDVLLYVRAEISDPDLGKALRAIYKSFQGDNTNHTTVEGQLITGLFHRARCILLLFTILEQESMQVSISHPEVQYLGKILISCCHAQTIGRDGADKDYYLTSWRSFSHLLLGGVTLETNECPERPSSSSNADVSLSVGHWRT